MRRQRLMDALNFKETDRVPKDLGSSHITGISCFNYAPLCKELGLKDRVPYVCEDSMMLALVEEDVLDALDCDVVYVDKKSTNAFDVSSRFKPYDFNGRLKANVYKENVYKVEDNGTIVLDNMFMLNESVVFTEAHGGQSIDLDNIYREPLDELRETLERELIDDREADRIAKECEIARSTGRAVFLNNLILGLGFIGGMANGSMLCMLEPEYIKEHSRLKAEYAVKNIEKVLPLVKDNVDVILSGGKDMGTQNSTIISPDALRELYLPFFKQVNDVIHTIDPKQKTFLHSCGAIFGIIDDIIDCGFDILNPVQWTAGGLSYKDWKDKTRGRIALWGGGINAQHVLPFANPDEVYDHVKEVMGYLKQGGGYVFNNIHNITGEIAPENIAAMYRAAGDA